MNDYDRANLRFLLSVTPEGLKDWYFNTSEDDHEYASEIMAQYTDELRVKSILDDDQEVINLEQAKAVLKGFTR